MESPNCFSWLDFVECSNEWYDDQMNDNDLYWLIRQILTLENVLQPAPT